MTMTVIARALVLVLVSCLPAYSQTRPEHDGKRAYFGTLHAHSELSGDVSVANGLSPEEAFDYARTHGLDFLGVSDHHKHPDAPGGAQYHMEDSEYQTLLDAAGAINLANPGTFVAIPGIEWGTVATGNHINIFGAATLPPDTIADTEYDELFAWVKTAARFAQCNHPYAWAAESDENLDVGNYGLALYASTDLYVAAADPALQLMSVICYTPSGHSGSEEKPHRETHSKALQIYREHLNYGLHLSPAGNQDTHKSNPGAASAARTGVWADELTLDGIAEAMSANRVFATEDDELAVGFQVRHSGVTYWMGETVPLDAESEVTVVVHVEQAPGSDGDSVEEGPYTARVHIDQDGVGGAFAAELSVYEFASAGDWEFPVTVAPGQYFFLEIEEKGGKDNPLGDGEDAAGADGGTDPDGFRDDLSDSAWTSPVWFSAGSSGATYVWSVNSTLYHDPGCWAVAQIGAANRREGPAPAGKTKHLCPN